MIAPFRAIPLFVEVVFPFLAYALLPNAQSQYLNPARGTSDSE